MQFLSIDQEWEINDGLYNICMSLQPNNDKRIVNLPHDYMVENDTDPLSRGGRDSGFYKSDVKNYNKKLMIPKEWEGQKVYLKFDGSMMNTTVEINGAKAALQHYGYAPFIVDITRYVYFGQENRVCITTNASTQPNSRWYTGAGLYRGLSLVHGPKLHIANDGIYGYTKTIEYDAAGNPVYALIKVEVDIENHTDEDRTAIVEVYLTREDSEETVISRKTKLQIDAGAIDTAYITMNVDNPSLWDLDTPELYEIHARLTEAGEFRTHEIPAENPMIDEDKILFGIKTVTVDARNGMRINNKTVKLKGGCLHHDNGMLGTEALYDAEYRKLSKLKEIGYNAIRTSHNPPSKVLLDAADHVGMYVYDEAFDTWNIGKVAGDYNQYFESDWKKDITAFIRRDRSRACVIMWSDGNEIPQRGGLDRGYSLATEICRYVKSLDSTRPMSNAICSYWSGLDDENQIKSLMSMMQSFSNAGLQNADIKDEADISWEEASWAFTNGLDVVGYNYMEDKYTRDHEMYPERVILGSENYPVEVGMHWPMIEETPYVIGEFTWTAFDYLGEAGLGRAMYLDKDDPRIAMGPMLMSPEAAGYPWRTANDADFDINGNLLAQGCYRSVVWGSDKTYLFVYSPETYGKQELLSPWGFPEVTKNWNYKAGDSTYALVFSNAEEVELFLNGKSIGRKKVDGKTRSKEMPKAVLFELVFEAGKLEAVGFTNGQEVSRDEIHTVGKPAVMRLTSEAGEQGLKADGHSLDYIKLEVLDGNGDLVNDAQLAIKVELEGPAELAAAGSGDPQATYNYTKGEFTTYQGLGQIILKSLYEPGEVKLSVSSEIGAQEIKLNIKC